MARKSLPKAELVHGQYYSGHCRNASVARWNGETQKFVYKRKKFDFTYYEDICHPDDDQVYDVFFASAVVESPDEELPLTA